ncbi:kinase [Streptomyces sp. NBRC 109706]|uniref:GHMP family kinase ATP-binding protein n=1 Tax=Streptomyces sp. NBRC 109706 TaxID=1550035 RepID=UPI000786043E|nr:kinase [Streptomyces sp. NBRC 109706]
MTSGTDTAGGCLGTGTTFGTFGELLQGVLPDGRAFLVTLPIDRWARARFHYRQEDPTLHVVPAHKCKAHTAARLALASVGRRGGGLLHLESDLPEGKGLASSSADLVATVRAVGDAIGVRFTPEEIEALLREIEPSDGVMYDGIVAFCHQQVRLLGKFGHLLPLTVVAHDVGGRVDTISHNRRPPPFHAAERQEYARLLAELREAVACGDLATVGHISTRSAELNRRIRARDDLEHLRSACRELDGIGLVLTHSGTMLGVAFASDDPELDVKTKSLRAACAALPGTVSVFRSLGAGGQQPARRGQQ